MAKRRTSAKKVVKGRTKRRSFTDLSPGQVDFKNAKREIESVRARLVDMPASPSVQGAISLIEIAYAAVEKAQNMGQPVEDEGEALIPMLSLFPVG